MLFFTVVILHQSSMLFMAHGRNVPNSRAEWRVMLGGLQRLGPWLVWLFLCAQFVGVIPLVYIDEMHEYGTLDGSSTQSIPAPHSRSHQHQPGTHDEHDQCCTLHHGVIGTLPDSFYQVVAPIADVVFEPAWAAPVSRGPARIDRPPKA